MDVVAKALSQFFDAEDQDDQEDEQARPHALSVQLYTLTSPPTVWVAIAELLLVRRRDCVELTVELCVVAAPIPWAIKSPMAGKEVARDCAVARDTVYRTHQ